MHDNRCDRAPARPSCPSRPAGRVRPRPAGGPAARRHRAGRAAPPAP